MFDVSVEDEKGLKYFYTIDVKKYSGDSIDCSQMEVEKLGDCDKSKKNEGNVIEIIFETIKTEYDHSFLNDYPTLVTGTVTGIISFFMLAPISPTSKIISQSHNYAL